MFCSFTNTALVYINRKPQRIIGNSARAEADNRS